jgi:hypothetical protein
MLSTKLPLVLRLKLNEQQKVKAVWVSGTDSMVKCGLAAVQIGTALLVKVSVFRYLVWIAYSVKWWTAWTVKVEAAICSEIWQLYSGQHGVISGEKLMFSGFVQNRLEYYWNVLLLVILKGTFSPTNLRALVYVNYVWNNVRYINICRQSSSYIPEPSNSFHSHFATNTSYPLPISFMPPLYTEFSRHILSNLLRHFFHLSTAFQNRFLWSVFSVTPQTNYIKLEWNRIH